MERENKKNIFFKGLDLLSDQLANNKSILLLDALVHAHTIALLILVQKFLSILGFMQVVDESTSSSAPDPEFRLGFAVNFTFSPSLVVNLTAGIFVLAFVFSFYVLRYFFNMKIFSDPYKGLRSSLRECLLRFFLTMFHEKKGGSHGTD